MLITVLAINSPRTDDAAYSARAFTVGIHLIGIDLEAGLHVEGSTRALCDLRGRVLTALTFSSIALMIHAVPGMFLQVAERVNTK